MSLGAVLHHLSYSQSEPKRELEDLIWSYSEVLNSAAAPALDFCAKADVSVAELQLIIHGPWAAVETDLEMPE